MNVFKNTSDMKEEEIISKHTAGANPFRTPDGYFDSFNERLMQRIAQQASTEPRPNVVSLRRRRLKHFSYAAAAVLAGVCITAGTYLWTRQTATPEQMLSAQNTETVTDEYIDAALDYEMINNRQIAYYLTEAY